jgi:lipopolysaccharide export system protein LptA
VLLMDLDHKAEAAPGRVPFPAQPIVLRPMGKDRFVVATANSLHVLDARSKTISASKAMPVVDLDVDGPKLAVISGNECVTMDEFLNETGRRSLPIPAKRVRCGGGLVVLLAPQTQQAGCWGIQPAQAVQAQATPAVEGSPEAKVVEAAAISPPTTVETAVTPATPETTAPTPPEPPAATSPTVAPTPAPEPTPTPTPEPSANPAPQAPPPAQSAAPSTVPESTAQASAVSAAAPPADAKAEEKKDADKSSYRQYPMFPGVLRAPRTMRASANPLEKPSKVGIRDALTRPIEFGEPSLGFSPPDWTEPLRDIEADSMKTDLTTGRTVLNDNVRLHLGKMAFRSDHFTYSNEAASYEASGSVLVEQADSKLTADKLTYNAPELKVAEESFILEPHDPQSLAKRRLSMGRLLADNLHMQEPTRELRADHVDYNFATEKGELINARGRAALFYYRAGKLQILGPKDTVAEDAWLTTCPNEDPHYRILMDEVVTENGEIVSAKGVHLQLGHTKLPFPIPFAAKGGGEDPWALDFATGSYAKTGSFINVAEQYRVSPELSLGPRLMPTSKQGVGLGGDITYDYTRKPSSRLFMTRGEMHGLYTTEDRGYFEWYHRYEYDDDLVLRVQAEQWSDQYFYKDFFWDAYKNRTTPRTFANVTYRQEDYIAAGTVNVDSQYWTDPPRSDYPKGLGDDTSSFLQSRAPGTEKLPEATFHLLERPLADHLYFSFDTVNGYYTRHYGHHVSDIYGTRSINTARLTYDWDPVPALAVTPFYEAQGAWYQNELVTQDSSGRFSNVLGVTAQTRFHREYPGLFNFSAFKHVVVPSVTLSYRPSSTMDADETPRFDALDAVEGRTRLESKISNVFYGRDAETKEVWQVCRLNLYQGNDFWNEVRKTSDYEVELDLRPRPWWGFQLVNENHNVDNGALSLPDARHHDPFGDLTDDWLSRHGNSSAYLDQTGSADYNRLLTQFYYDDTMRGGKFNSRIGYAYSDTAGQITNEAILYGVGVRLGELWSASAEHLYDIHDGAMLRQTYEIRRVFHCFEAGLRIRERQSGWDVGLKFGLAAFSGPPLKF